ncbi:MAG: hypothetical protein JJ899_00710 [Alphaproteobacteria bacterium]|nr:hypothetical protein [Alphaproteobacteria bacterium]
METIDITPEEMEKRIARLDDLKPNKNELAERAGIPPEAYEFVAAKDIFLLMAKPKDAELSNSQPVIEGPDGASVYVVGTPPNDGPTPHAHMTTYETFMPLTGRYRFDYGRNAKHSTIVNPFEMISVPPGVIRQFTNIEDFETRMLVIIQGEDENALNDIIMPPSVGAEIAERWGEQTKAKIEEMGMLFNADEESAEAAE